MQITINQNEIEQAIEDFVKSQVSINDDQKITMELKATRGDAGFQAVIEITAAQPVAEDAPKTRKPRATRVSTETADPNEQNGNVPAGKEIKDAPESDETQKGEDPAPVEEDKTEASPPAFLKQGSIFGNAQTA